MDDPLHEDAGSMYLIGVKLSGSDDDLGLRYGDFAASCGQGIEVACCASKDQVPVQVGFPCFYQGQVGAEAAFEDVGCPIELFVFLAFGDDGSDSGTRVEAGNSGASGAHAFRQSALRNELDFEFSLEKLPFELSILSDIAGDHLSDLPAFEQQAQPPTVHSCVIACDCKVPDPRITQRQNQCLRNAA